MTTKRNVKVNTPSVDDVVFNGVITFLGKQTSRAWTGTMTELSVGVVRSVSKNSASVLPGSPSSFRVVLDRVVNRLRNRRISVKFGRTTDHTRTRYVRFAR
jgi:hypothetical protein